jgi:hypothetical protein
VSTATETTTRSARSADQRDLVVAGVTLALAAVAVQTALYLVDVYALDRRVGTFDLDSEGGFPAWAASVATFSTGFVALLLSFVEPARRLGLLALAAATTFFSFDESIVLHERLGLAVTGALDLSDKYLRVAWPAVYLPLLAAVAALLFQLARTSTGSARRLLAVGLVLLGGAVGLEIAGLGLDLIPRLTETAWLYTFQIALEEGAELAGWILLTTGLAVRLLARAGSGRVSRAVAGANARQHAGG